MVEKDLMSPRGAVVAGAKALTAATVVCSFRCLEKQEIELLNVKMTTTVLFPRLISVP